jgi:hypothetical protein
MVAVCTYELLYLYKTLVLLPDSIHLVKIWERDARPVWREHDVWTSRWSKPLKKWGEGGGRRRGLRWLYL